MKNDVILSVASYFFHQCLSYLRIPCVYKYIYDYITTQVFQIVFSQIALSTKYTVLSQSIDEVTTLSNICIMYFDRHPVSLYLSLFYEPYFFRYIIKKYLLRSEGSHNPLNRLPELVYLYKEGSISSLTLMGKSKSKNYNLFYYSRVWSICIAIRSKMFSLKVFDTIFYVFDQYWYNLWDTVTRIYFIINYVILVFLCYRLFWR